MESPRALTTADTEQPAKQCNRIRSSRPYAMDRLGVLSGWAGQRAVHPLPDFRTRSRRDVTRSKGRVDIFGQSCLLHRGENFFDPRVRVPVLFGVFDY